MKTLDFLVKAIYNGKEYRRMVRYKYDDLELFQECFEEKINIRFKNGETKTIEVSKYQFIADGEMNSLLYAPELINIDEDTLGNIEGISENFVFRKDNVVYVIADEETFSIIKSSLKYL